MWDVKLISISFIHLTIIVLSALHDTWCFFCTPRQLMFCCTVLDFVYILRTSTQLLIQSFRMLGQKNPIHLNIQIIEEISCDTFQAVLCVLLLYSLFLFVFSSCSCLSIKLRMLFPAKILSTLSLFILFFSLIPGMWYTGLLWLMCYVFQLLVWVYIIYLG